MSTRTQQSLIPIVERLPVPQNQSPHGNYRTSLFRATCSSFDGQNEANVPIDPAAANPFPMLLFISDFSAIQLARTEYQALTFPVVGGGGGSMDVTGPFPDMREDAEELGDVSGGDWPTLITNPEAAGVDSGSNVRGTTFTGGFQVSGLPIHVQVTDNGYLNIAGGAAMAILTLTIVAQCEIKDGYPVYLGINTAPLGPGGGDFASGRPVILQESDYTEAIRDPDPVTGKPANAFIDANGFIFTVVGIWFNSQP